MGRKVKEEEKIERIIRGLLKLAENRRCINCNSVGPQYVCTTFLIFICTTCSGIHREYTHRVKSVSMARFSMEEVVSLQAGGNERAREIYLKDWDPQRHSLPDGSNLHKLREFIKHVYVDRRYAGDRNVNELPMVEVGNNGARSSNLERHMNERSFPSTTRGDTSIKYYYDERRSPRFARENSRSGGFKRNPVRFEIVDDRVRDDRVGGGRQTDSRRFSNAEPRQVSTLPDSQRKVNVSDLPEVQPVSNILGANVSPLHASKLYKTNDRKGMNTSAPVNKIASYRSIESVDGHPAEPEMVKLGSLIDLSANPGPPDAVVVSQTQPVQSTSSGNLASAEESSKSKFSHFPSTDLLDLLSELSVPVVVPSTNLAEGSSDGNIITTQVGVSSTSPPINMLELPNYSASLISTSMPIHSEGAPGTLQVGKMPTLTGDSGDSINEVPEQLQLQNMQKCSSSASLDMASSLNGQQTSQLDGSLKSKPQTSSFVSNMQGPFSTSEKSYQSSLEFGQGIIPPVGLQPLPMEAKPSGTKELPADLFTTAYTPNLSAFPGWQTASPFGVGFRMQYNPVPMTANSVKSTNPFDLNDDQPQVQATVFPSMAYLQGEGALPSLSDPVSISASSLGFLPQTMQPQSLSNVSPMPPQLPYELPMSTSPYARLKMPNTLLTSGQQGTGSTSGDAAAFGSTNTNQLSGGRYLLPATPDSLSSLECHGMKFGLESGRTVFTSFVIKG